MKTSHFLICSFAWLNVLVASSLAASVPDTQLFSESDFSVCSAMGRTAGSAAHEVDPSALADDGSVWRVGTQRWNAAWEKRYSEWISKEVDEEVFLRTNISTDCADAALVIRMIFAKLNHLPVLFKNEPQSFSNSMKKWSKYPTLKDWDGSNWVQSARNDQRFRAFVQAVTEEIGTKNIADSTYPVRLKSPQNPEQLSAYVAPGTLVLGGGHTRFIFKVDSGAYIPIEQLDSTVPSEVRTLHRGPVQMWGMPDEKLQDGVIRFKWVVNCGGRFIHVPAEKMPGYSLEQYHLSDATGNGLDFNAYLISLVPGKRKPLDRTYVDLELQSLKSLLDRRIESVNTATRMASTNLDAFKDPQVRDDYTTEHRDAGIVKTYTYLYGRLSMPEQNYLESQAKKVRIPIEVGKFTNLLYFIEATREQLVSPDPSATPAKRWGFDYLALKVKDLEAQNVSIARNIPAQKAALSWSDRVKYLRGVLQLPAQRHIAGNSADIQALKKMIGQQ